MYFFKLVFFKEMHEPASEVPREDGYQTAAGGNQCVVV